MEIAQSELVYDDPMESAEGGLLASESLWPSAYPLWGEAPIESWRYQYVKRGIDLFSVLIMIAVFAIPGLVIAAAIVLTSKGPVFYREQRVGQGGRSFRIWKFRSMHQNAAQRAHIADVKPGGNLLMWRMRKDLRDPRITWVGKYLRCWSLDELPQLLNVLSGEMSLIGPRPVVEAETVLYGDFLPYYLAAVPGLSGLWQLSGRSKVDYGKRVRLDAKYVQTWSLLADLKILLRTVPAVLGRVGAN